MAVDFVEAARSQLATWLTAQLLAQFPTLTLLDQWPAPGRPLALPSIAVQVIGPPERNPHAPMAHRVTPTTLPAGLVTYSYGRLSLGMQLDLWGSTPAERNSLTMAVEQATNVNPIYSLPIVGALPDYKRGTDLMLRLTDFYNVLAQYRFQQESAPTEDSDAEQAGEWRALFTGDVLFHAVTQEACTILQRIVIGQTINDANAETFVIQ